MALPTYVDIVSTDIDQDSPIDDDLVAAIRDNCTSTRFMNWGAVHFPLQSTGVSASWTQTDQNIGAVTYNHAYPGPMGSVEATADTNYAGFTLKAVISVEAYVTSGTGKLRFMTTGGNGVNGSEVDVTATGAGTVYEISVDIDIADYGVRSVLEVEFKSPAGQTITIPEQVNCTGRIEY